MGFIGQGFDPNTGVEINCADTLDDDGDGLFDCDDPDCWPASVCGFDPCCFPGDATWSAQCNDQNVVDCVCGLSGDPFCCDPFGGWLPACVDLYTDSCWIDPVNAPNCAGS